MSILKSLSVGALQIGAHSQRPEDVMRTSIPTRTIVWVTIVAVILMTAFAGYSPSFAGGATSTPVVNDNGNSNGPAPTVETPLPVDTAVPPAPTEIIAATAVPATPVVLDNSSTATPVVVEIQPSLPAPVVVEAPPISRIETYIQNVVTDKNCDKAWVVSWTLSHGAVVVVKDGVPQQGGDFSHDWTEDESDFTGTFWFLIWHPDDSTSESTGDETLYFTWSQTRPTNCVTSTVEPSATRIPPTVTHTETPTEVPPSATPSATFTNTPLPTNTPTVTPSNTPLPSATPTFTATYTATSTATHTETPAPTVMPTYTPSQTPLAPTATQPPPVVEVEPSATPSQPTVEPTQEVVDPQGQPDVVRMVTNWAMTQYRRLMVTQGGSSLLSETMELSKARPLGVTFQLGKIVLPMESIEPNKDRVLNPGINAAGCWFKACVIHNDFARQLEKVQKGQLVRMGTTWYFVSNIAEIKNHEVILAQATDDQWHVLTCKTYDGKGKGLDMTLEQVNPALQFVLNWLSSDSL